jgi:hypothetical protein
LWCEYPEWKDARQWSYLTGKYAGITGTSRLHVIHCPALAGEGSYTLMDIPHNTTWKSKDNNLTLRARSPAPQPGFLFSASPLPASATPQCRCEF